MNTDEASAVALMALSYIFEDEDRRDRFFALTGYDPDDLKQSFNSPEFLGGVLDYILLDESLLLNFVETSGLDPNTPRDVRSILPGFTPSE